ncbi:MAG TPA: EAL domain-containing protein [Stenomitos sp.]
MHSILIVDNEPDNFDVIETLISDQPYQLHYASSGLEALSVLDLYQPDLILLDVMMPVMDGIEVCQRIKAMPQWQAVPIIMVTALTAKNDLAQCLAAGADDFISKPINRLELKARMGSMLRIRQQYQQLATFNAQLETAVQQRTAQLKNMIFQDALTGLPSRALLLQHLSERLADKETPCAVIYIDCDQFKLVNGSFGHVIGDRLLFALGERLQQHLRPGDVLARMGEDEFCFLLGNFEDEYSLETFVQGVLQSLNKPFSVSNFEVYMSACAGVAISSEIGQHAEELVQDADTAMYQAKLRGKSSYQIFDRQMRLGMLQRLTLEKDLQLALERHEFVLYYQPIIHLRTQQIAGLEALIRWHHPERGVVSPAEFIPSMETTGLIVPVGLLALKQACCQLREWHRQGWPNLTMSINLSARQFACPTLLADIDSVLEETGVNPACIKLEITESAIMENAEIAIALTRALRSRQLHISIDDFGTGYSSLGYLHRFPVSNLKIDRSFVNQIQSENCNYHIVDTIVALSKQLGLSVIAEGIETEEQLEWLKQLNCEFGQGYLFSKPLPASDITKTYLATVQV